MDADDDLMRAASMYYLQDLKMDVIARHLGTSRSTVSRMIKRARQSGLVEITLRPAATHAPGLTDALSTAWGIDVHVVSVPDGTSDVERLEQVARTAARLLSSWFDSDMVLGVAWGTTLAAIARQLSPKTTRGSAIVQLNGAANTRTTGVEYATDLISSFGAAFAATVHHFSVPAFFDYPDTRQAMWRERSIRHVLALQAQVDIAVFGIGALTGPLPSHVYSAGYLDDDDLRTLREERVVGDVCTVFLREDGSWRDVSLNQRATGPSPAQLRRIPRRVAVVASDSKVVPLLAALRARVATDLVIDERTATTLLELTRLPSERRPRTRPAEQ